MALMDSAPAEQVHEPARRDLTEHTEISPERARREVERHGGWRQDILARACRLDLALGEVTRRMPQHEQAHVHHLISIAVDAAGRKQGFGDWWYGTLIERAWVSLHEAEVAIVARMTPQHAAIWWQEGTGHVPAQARPWSAPPPAPVGESDLYAIAHSLRSYYDQADRAFEHMRSFRNTLMKLTAIGVVATALLVWSGAAGMWRVQALSGQAPTAVDGSWEFLLVALFGVVGAFITSLSPLSRMPAKQTPFALPLFQLMLKLVVGPVFALIGVLAIQGEFVQQVQPFTDFGAAVLIWAVIFGGFQQTLTRTLDVKAQSLTVAKGLPTAITPVSTASDDGSESRKDVNA